MTGGGLSVLFHTKDTDTATLGASVELYNSSGSPISGSRVDKGSFASGTGVSHYYSLTQLASLLGDKPGTYTVKISVYDQLDKSPPRSVSETKTFVYEPTTLVEPPAAPVMSITPDWSVPVGAKTTITVSTVDRADEYRVLYGTTPGKYDYFHPYTGPVTFDMPAGVDFYLSAVALAKGTEGTRSPEQHLQSVAPAKIPFGKAGECALYEDGQGQIIMPYGLYYFDNGQVTPFAATFKPTTLADGGDGKYLELLEAHPLQALKACDAAFISDMDTLAVPLGDGSWLGMDLVKRVGNTGIFSLTDLGGDVATGNGFAATTQSCDVSAACTAAMVKNLTDQLYNNLIVQNSFPSVASLADTAFYACNVKLSPWRATCAVAKKWQAK